MTRPAKLYHYTRQRGVMAILSTGRIWASRIQYLNDGRELQHALDLAKAETEARLVGAVDRVSEFLTELRRRLDNVVDANVLVCSFSARDDLVSQWRAYTSPGDAFAIGFDLDRLQSVSRSIGWYFSNCLYDVDQQKRIFASAIGLEMAQVSAIGIGGDITPNVEGCLAQIVPWAPLMKDPCFGEEEEWRLVSPPLKTTSLEFRPGRFSLIPYLEVDLASGGTDLGGVDLVVGPCQYPVLSLNAARMLIRACGIHGDARSSIVSLRDW